MPNSTVSCSACGTPVSSEQRYCPQCGADASGQFAALIPGGLVSPPRSPSTDSAWDAVAARLRLALAGEFEVFGILGQGGMAAVFLALEYALNRKVALKVMSPALMMGDGMIERFRQEAITQANLQHANIVAMHGVRSVDDLQFFVMQFIPGRTVQQAIRAEAQAGRPLEIGAIRSILYQTGSALAYAHRRGVIHRDVKPGNILLNADGDAVVTDFGIAKVTENPALTMTGAVVGTPAYMSPEQCFAGDLTPASDQYSLGVVAYELLTGHPPFEGPSFAVMQGHTMQEPRPIRELRADCPPELEAALQLMLAKYPDDRFPDMVEALQGLGAAAASQRADDPVRQELRRLSDVSGVEDRLASLLRAAPSPIPQGKRANTPAAPHAKALTPQEATTIQPNAPSTQVHARSGPVPGSPPVVPGRRRWIVIGGVALAATAAVAAIALSPTPPPVLQAPPSEPGNTPVETPLPSAPRAPRLSIAPSGPTTVAAGERLRLVAQGDSLSEGTPVEWTSRSPAVISVDRRTGVAAAVRSGRSVIVATRGSSVDSIVLTVTAAAEGLATATAPPPASTAVVPAPASPVETRASHPPEPQPQRLPAATESAATSVKPPGPDVSPARAASETDDPTALWSGARAAIGGYAAALSTRDTGAIRRAFPAAGVQVMTRWQSMFDVSERVRVTITDVQPVDAFPPAVGATARVRVRQQVAFAVRGAREQSSTAEFVATLRRDGIGWTIVSVTDR